eukprot:565737-Pyramimonas_sp.AAC.1
MGLQARANKHAEICPRQKLQHQPPEDDCRDVRLMNIRPNAVVSQTQPGFRHTNNVREREEKSR